MNISVWVLHVVHSVSIESCQFRILSDVKNIYISQYGSTVYIGIAMVYPHCKPYIRILFIFTFNFKLISLLICQGRERVKNNLYTKIGSNVM